MDKLLSIRGYIIFLLLVFSLNAYTQEQLIDSLYKESRSDITPERRVIVLADLGYFLRYQNIDRSVRLGEEAVQLSRSLKNKYYATYAWHKMYYVYWKAKKKDKQEAALDSVSLYAKQTNDNASLGMYHATVGNKAWLENHEDKAVEESLLALDLLTESRMWDDAVRSCYILASIVGIRENLPANEKYARKALHLSDQSNSPTVKCYADLLMGDYFEGHYKKYNDQLSKDSATFYFQQGVDTYKKNEELIKAPFLGGNTALNYANHLFLHYPEVPKDSVTAILFQAIQWATRINDEPVLAMCYAFLGDYLGREGSYDKAELMLTLSLAKLEKSETIHYHAICNLVTGLINLSERRGDKDKTIKYYKLYVDYYRKLFDSEEAQTINDLESKFEKQKKAQELEVLKKESMFRQKINYFSIGVAVLSLIVMFFIFLSYHLKLKSTNQKKQLLEAENNEAQMQALLKEAEQKLIRQQNEQLQKEVFAGAVQIKQKNELLETVRREVTTTVSGQKIDKIIKENLQTDDSFEEYKSLIKKTHPDFFNHLQEQAKTKLTELDFKYCTFIYLKIPAKEMAIRLHVEYNTIRMNKHRLKQKFNLEKADDLDAFIRGII